MHLRLTRALPGTLRGSLPHRRHIECGKRRHLRHESGQFLVGKRSWHTAMLPAGRARSRTTFSDSHWSARCASSSHSLCAGADA
jgi:hypothetical protein